jgi:hypothetical protein
MWMAWWSGAPLLAREQEYQLRRAPHGGVFSAAHDLGRRRAHRGSDAVSTRPARVGGAKGEKKGSSRRGRGPWCGG